MPIVSKRSERTTPEHDRISLTQRETRQKLSRPYQSKGPDHSRSMRSNRGMNPVSKRLSPRCVVD